MKTKIIRINPKNPEISRIKKAADILRKGGLVAFPTETVYGLGANALNSRAVKKIFGVKGRPFDNPLIVHIADKKEIYRLADEIPEKTEKLMNAFWPGPLTLILKKSKAIPRITTVGLNTVAIRMPSHPIALALIRQTKNPIAAPSANLSGKPSPTSAEHVKQDLCKKIDAIIDSDDSDIGIESSVLDMTVNPPMLLRPGKITLNELRKILGKVEIHPSIRSTNRFRISKSPGMKYRHYAPNARIILIEGNKLKVRKKIQELAGKYKKQGKTVGILCIEKNSAYTADSIKFAGKNLEIIAKNLFKIFREFDKEKIEIVLAEKISDKGLGLAIGNRLKRAAFQIINT